MRWKIFGAVALAVVMFVGGFALGHFGVFPLLPWQVPTLDQTGAAVSTANATWFQVVVTFLAFGATVGVFASAFILQRRQSEDAAKLQRAQFEEAAKLQREQSDHAAKLQLQQFEDDRAKAAEARRSNGRDAIETIRRAHVLVTAMRNGYCQVGALPEEDAVWADLSIIQTQQVIIQHFINSPLTDLDVLFLLGSASQRVYAIRDALKRLVPEGGGVLATELSVCRKILVQAVKRVDGDQAKLSEAARRDE